MKKLLLTGIRAISQVLFIAVLHLFVIHFLNLKVGVWDEEATRQAFLVYSVLTLLLFVTCMMSLVTKKLRYNITWFCISTIPSISLLILLYKSKVNEPTENNFIDLNFESGFFELVMIIPFIYFVIQLFFMISLWILKFQKKE